MTAATAADADLFEKGPPCGMQRRFGLIKPGVRNVATRAALVVAVGWLPPVLLTVGQNLFWQAGGIHSLMLDAGMHARYLIAAPLLVLAEVECAPRLTAIVRHFMDAGIVPEDSRAQFHAVVASVRRQLDSNAAEAIVVALAYLVVVAAIFTFPDDQTPAWRLLGGTGSSYSAAGWWSLLVSLPLLIVLLLGWIWRLILWTRLLWLVSRLDLRLVASHPDHAAGLGFLGQSIRAFAIVALAIAVIAAGRSAHLVLLGSGLPTPLMYFNAGFLAFVLAIFIAPLLAFSLTLQKAWHQGTFEYGALADKVGNAFEGKWLGSDKHIDRTALDKSDFSATTDLYQIVSNVYAIRFVPMDIKDLIPLVAAVVLPFVPIALLAVPADTVLQALKKLLL